MDRIDLSKFLPLAEALEGTDFDEMVIAQGKWTIAPSRDEITAAIISSGETDPSIVKNPARMLAFAKDVAGRIVAHRVTI